MILFNEKNMVHNNIKMYYSWIYTDNNESNKSRNFESENEDFKILQLKDLGNSEKYKIRIFIDQKTC